MWVRARFKANLNDYRPVKFPPPGPYWCTGYSALHSIVVAYVKEVGEIQEFWPEAKDIDTEEVDAIEYTDRFPRPSWYK